MSARKAAALAVFLFLIPFSKAAVEVSFFLLLFLWLGGWKRASLQGLRTIPSGNRPPFLLLGIFLTVCFFSAVTSPMARLSLDGFIGKWLEYGLLFLIAADLAVLPQVNRRAVHALLAAAGLVILWGLLQEWILHAALYPSEARDFITGKRLDYIRMVGPYENPNDLATFLMVSGLVIAGWLLRARKGEASLASCVVLALIAGCLAWTRSMGGLLGTFCGLALLGWRHRGNRRLVWSLAAAGVSAAAFFLLTSSEALDKLLTFSDIASNDRASMWKTGWAMFIDRPLWGHGLNTFMANYTRFAPDAAKNPAYAHNCYLQMAAETGLIGLTAFLLFLGGSARAIWKGLKAVPDPALEGLTAALLGFLIQSLFDTNFYALRQAVLFWTLAGAAVGISSELRRVENAS